MAVDPCNPDPRRPGPDPAARQDGATPLHPHRPAPPAGPVETAVGDTVDAAVAVLAVAAAIGRYAVEVGVRVPRSAVRRLPVAGIPVPGGWRAAVGRLVAGPRAAMVRALGAAADDLVPRVVREILSRVDVPALVQEYVDVDRLAAQIDVNAVTARVDVDRIVGRVDVEAIAAGLDLDALAEKIDIGRIVGRVDVEAIAAGLDLDALAEKIDIGRIIGRMDLDEIVGRVDLDRAVARVDVDRILARTDLVGLARYVIDEIDLAAVLRSSTGSVTTEMVRSVRDQGVDADRAVERVVDRLLRRPGRRPDRPSTPAPEDDGAAR
jgi:hypothetical protein